MTDNGAQIGLVLDCADPEVLGVLGPSLWLREPRHRRRVRRAVPGRPARPEPAAATSAGPKAIKNRMHFDSEVADIHAEVDRLVALGATQVSAAPCSEHGSTGGLMNDREGDEFGVCDRGQPG